MLKKPAAALVNYLARLTAQGDRPLVLLLDEADGLVGPAMVSFLTQLRAGYIARSEAPFPSSVALVGLRQVRDYVLDAEDRRALSWLGTTSPFNITAVKDRGTAITALHVDSAKETIILERRSHIDSLVARLREPRVRRVLESMLTGASLPVDVFDDDLSYALGLGLVRVERGELQIANPIYREVIPRALTWPQQISIHQPTEWYVRADGTLDLPRLMAAWQVFWRKDGHLAAEGFTYREAGPHLMLMAFLQRIVNGGGRVEREYGLGRGALDLMISWKAERHAIEVKIRRDTETEAEALEQVARYLDRAGLGEGWLVMFDVRKEPPWTDKLFVREVEHATKRIHIVGC